MAVDVHATDRDRGVGQAGELCNTLIMASSDLDEVPLWLRTAAWSLRRMFVRRFRAAVRDDPGPYLAEVARYRPT